MAEMYRICDANGNQESCSTNRIFPLCAGCSHFANHPNRQTGAGEWVSGDQFFRQAKLAA